MNNFNPLLLTDSYKVHHKPMYPDNMTKLYSNGTCRKSRFPNIQHTIVFGLQHFILTYLIKSFNDNFFFNRQGGDINRLYEKKDKLISDYKRHNPVDTKHIEDLWDLGYLPIEIKSLDEGTLCPIGVPMFTITNTHPDHGWLVNYLETLISCCIWQAYTSATLAYEFRKLLNKYAMETTGSTEGVQWQGHDFSMRGMSSPESAILSGMGHLLSFTGTDTIPAIYQLEESYDATGLIGASVPATEHSVMCMGTKEAEIDTFRRLLSIYPTGILSVVSDTWNLWTVLTDYLPQLKEEILARDGKLVIRPDSGDPVDIICGTYQGGKLWSKMMFEKGTQIGSPEVKGVIELLWDIFGGTINEQGYKVLDSHIGAIYGDSINMERAEQICERLKAKGFASTNVVLGIGSFTYQYNTRDTFGFAMKATYGELFHDAGVKYFQEDSKMNGGGGAITGEQLLNCIESREIFKDPITDDGTKKSKKGLLCVIDGKRTENGIEKDGIGVIDQCTWAQESKGLLTTVFKDGVLVKRTTLDEIRGRLAL